MTFSFPAHLFSFYAFSLFGCRINMKVHKPSCSYFYAFSRERLELALWLQAQEEGLVWENLAEQEMFAAFWTSPIIFMSPWGNKVELPLVYSLQPGEPVILKGHWGGQKSVWPMQRRTQGFVDYGFYTVWGPLRKGYKITNKKLVKSLGRHLYASKGFWT